MDIMTFSVIRTEAAALESGLNKTVLPVYSDTMQTPVLHTRWISTIA